MTFWVWNVTNPEEVLIGDEPVLQETGPYVYDEYRWKDGPGAGTPFGNLFWTHENELVHYDGHKVFVFSETESRGNRPDDEVTLLNLPVIAFMDKLDATIGHDKILLAEAVFALRLLGVNVNTVFHKRTVGKALFGYRDALTEFLYAAGAIPSALFGLQENGTLESKSIQFTGAGDISRIGTYKQWNGMETLPYWSTDDANVIRGTDGSQFAPDVHRDDTLWIFVDDAGRSAKLKFQNDSTVEDIDVYRFGIDPVELLNVTDCPANVGFNGFGPSGVLNLTSVKNATLFLSKPHFLDAWEGYAEAVKLLSFKGTTLDRDAYDTILEVEPITGVTMNAVKRLQPNVPLRSYDWFPGAVLVPSALFPVIWIEEAARISPTAADKFKSEVRRPLDIARPAKVVCLVLSILSFLAAVALFAFARKPSSEYEAINSDRA
eukprot:NODE_1028_length_1753_cov_49.293427_g836_i1.p1 GENE.NODE_1028_length_1753_cov_49.293427_g836_i1~~NODE_1028_length_1753_cov_49.293427_g836_i1.p1  ORF type:complete len:434 (+),score=59.41 NODE_1028_length_1753_cov_49.293427_g836_i1:284-1585(+)